jgi:hypothetical protein
MIQIKKKVNKRTSFLKTFDAARNLNSVQLTILITTTACNIASTILYQKSLTEPGLSDDFDVVNAVATVFGIAYIAVEIVANAKFFQGGRKKRLDLVDHAFDTNMSGEKSVGYFNAGGARSGIYRLGVLTFENSLFTSEVAKSQLFSKWLFSSILCTTFFFYASMGNKEKFNLIIQLAATGIFIHETIRFQLYSNRMSSIYACFLTLFNTLKTQADKSSMDGEIIKNVLEYEATHAWACVLLSTKNFNKLNPDLSLRWEDLKQQYEIR